MVMDWQEISVMVMVLKEASGLVMDRQKISVVMLFACLN